MTATAPNPPTVAPAIPRPARAAERRHIAALDGLRGLAIAGVLMYHAGSLRGGFLGVDLFFVLSGFLITGLLIDEYRGSGRIDVRQFWIRRFRRLMPAALALVLAVAVLSAVADVGNPSQLRGDGLATLFYVANWNALLTEQTYWQQFAQPALLDHTWSLAIEEQFYLIWPLLLWGLFRFTRASLGVLLAVCLGLAAASEVALFAFYEPGNSDRAYLGTDSRGAAILLGAALATLLAIHGLAATRMGRWVLEAAALMAAGGLAVAWYLTPGQGAFLYRGGFLATELAVLVVLAAAAHPNEGIVARALAFPPLVWLGTISYGAYLWHWPIYQVLTPERLGFDSWPLTAVRISVSLIVAALSAVLLEQPIRRNGLPRGWSPRWVVPVAIVAVVSAVVVTTRSAPAPATELVAVPPNPATGFTDATPGARRILVAGDSVGLSLGISLADVAGTANTKPAVANVAAAGCSLFTSDTPTRDRYSHATPALNCTTDWANEAARLRPTDAVILVGGITKGEVLADGRWQKACEAGWDRAYATALTRGINGLARSGTRVTVMTAPNYWTANDPAEGAAMVDCVNRINAEVVRSIPGTTLVDLAGFVCPGGICRGSHDGEPIRKDGLHFAGAGGLYVAEWVLTQLPKER